jgi:hypothetical protein
MASEMKPKTSLPTNGYKVKNAKRGIAKFIEHYALKILMYSFAAIIGGVLAGVLIFQIFPDTPKLTTASYLTFFILYVLLTVLLVFAGKWILSELSRWMKAMRIEKENSSINSIFDEWSPNANSIPQDNDGTYKLKFDWSKATRWPTLLFMLLAAAVMMVHFDHDDLRTTWSISTIVIVLIVLAVFIHPFTWKEPKIFHILALIFSLILLAFGGLLGAYNTFDWDDPLAADFFIPFIYFCYLCALVFGHIAEFIRRKDIVPMGFRLMDGIGSLFFFNSVCLYRNAIDSKGISII